MFPFRGACSTIGTPAVSKTELVYHVLFLLILSAFAVYDVKHKRVPNVALACFLPFVLLSLPIGMANSFQLFPFWLLPVMGALAGGGTLLAAAMATGGGVGGGDIKLAAMLGFVYGPYGILFALLFAAPLTLLFGIWEQRRTGNRRFSLPFVPFLAMGCCAAAILKLYQI